VKEVTGSCEKITCQTPAKAGATKKTKVAQALAGVWQVIFSQLPVTSFFFQFGEE